MRKAIGVALAGLTVLMFVTAPAHALKDPFEPLVKPESESDTTTNGTTTVDEPTVTSGENPFSEGMPNTGADTSSWLVLSYVLLVAGGAALVLAWTRRPAPARRQVFRS
jgi:LPXTG-motif cell wall-anchored protein